MKAQDAQERVRILEGKLKQMEDRIAAMRKAKAATCALCKRQEQVRAARPNGTMWPGVEFNIGGKV